MALCNVRISCAVLSMRFDVFFAPNSPKLSQDEDNQSTPSDGA
jgi:hypothetical protein